MIYPSIDKLLNIVDSKYQLVHIASKRSLEIDKTKHLQKKEEEYEAEKNIGRSLEELNDGLIEVKTKE